MSPFKKLKELYKDEEYKILLKAPILASLMVISIILLFSLIVVLILSDDPQIIRIILDFIMLSAIIISLILVIRKRYNRAVTVILSCGFFAIGAITISQSFLTKQVIQANALNLTFMLILTALFANSKKQTLFFCLGSLIVLISSSVIALLKGNIYVEIMEPIPQILISTLVLGVSVSALIFLKSIEIKILDDINEKLRQAKIDDIKKFDLISSSAKQMDKTLNLSALAKNTLGASSSIDLKLGTVTEQINILQKNFHSSVEALNQIDTSVEKLKNLSDNQASNVTESSSSIEEMSASITNVTKVINQRQTTVSNLMKLSVTGEELLDNTIESFDSVLKHLESIKDMTTIIDNIASQTNLLSMNAAIESAHAGDAGKGFAVVAEEIRKLADSSSQNAGEISSTVNSLVESIDIAGKEINETGSSFKEMHKQITEVSVAIDEISSNATELSTGSKEILIATSNLNELTSEVSSSVIEVQESQRIVSSDMNSVLGSADTVLGSVTEILERTSEITKEVNQIKTTIDTLIEHSQLLNKEIES